MGYLVGLDVGGSHIDVLVVDEAFALVAERSVSVDKSRLPDQMIGLIEQVTDGRRIHAIGIGFPGQIDIKRGVVELAVHMIDEPLPLRDRLTAVFGVPIFIENDANAFVVGAMEFLNHDDIDSAAFVTLGTGVGVGLWLEGRLFRGSRGLAGELGHTVFAPNSPHRCGCGNYGCLDVLVWGGGGGTDGGGCVRGAGFGRNSRPTHTPTATPPLT